MEKIENMVAEIERCLRDEFDREVSSRIIGEMVMDKLKETDDVAYVRFASVYCQFADLNSFIQTIEQLKASPKPRNRIDKASSALPGLGSFPTY